MKVGVVGASGLIGGAVLTALEQNGHQWVGFSRSPAGRKGEWRTLQDGLSGLDAIVNLAGDSIDKRWTDENKKRFYESRVGVTEDIVAALKELPASERPGILVNASAVGYYGDQADTVLTEAADQGTGYLAELCEQWEAAAEKAKALGLRVVLGRIGVVLASQASAWQRMKPVFSIGIGGKLGSGKQYWPIVHVDDITGAILHILTQDAISGPVNLVGQTTVTNTEFTQSLGQLLSRPTIFSVPAFALKLVFGGFSDALLASYRVEADVLQKSGYSFKYPTLAKLLSAL